MNNTFVCIFQMNDDAESKEKYLFPMSKYRWRYTISAARKINFVTMCLNIAMLKVKTVKRCKSN